MTDDVHNEPSAHGVRGRRPEDEGKKALAAGIGLGLTLALTPLVPTIAYVSVERLANDQQNSSHAWPRTFDALLPGCSTADGTGPTDDGVIPAVQRAALPIARELGLCD